MYKSVLSYIFVNHSSGMLPLLVFQHLKRFLECRRHLEPKVKLAQISGTSRETLHVPYCVQQH